jgi:hypothetical protein
METSKLIGPALDWAVAKCEGMKQEGIWLLDTENNGYLLRLHFDGMSRLWWPSTDWAQGGPIIERERIVVYPWHDSGEAAWNSFLRPMEMFKVCGPTPLIAAMRCYVASKLGDKIDVPKELL